MKLLVVCLAWISITAVAWSVTFLWIAAMEGILKYGKEHGWDEEE